ncbi:hypothetical protein AC249_AIPGENE9178, partial [Exaiptasia diaphana]
MMAPERLPGHWAVWEYRSHKDFKSSARWDPVGCWQTAGGRMFDLTTLAVGGISLKGVIEKQATQQLVGLFGKGLEKITGPLKQDPYLPAMVQAFEGFARVVFSNIESLGYDEDELERWAPGIAALIEDSTVADELWLPLINAESTAPDIDVLRETWIRLGEIPMPEGFRWEAVSVSYRRRVERRRIVDEKLRPQLQVELLRQLRDEVRGAQPKGDLARYAARMRTKYRVLDLSDFVNPTVMDEPRRGLLLREAFVPQRVREDPPPVEVPRDLVRRLADEGRWKLDEQDGLDLGDRELSSRMEQFQATYLKRPVSPVLEVLEGTGGLVVVGGPGSGKSTLTRYVLLDALD